MAITKEQNPSEHSPAHNPLVYVWSSDNTNEPNFSFAIRIFLNSAVIYTDVVYPTNGDYAYFDCRPIVENYIKNSSLNPKEISINADQLELEISEIYGTPPIPQSRVNFSDIFLYNISLSDLQFSPDYLEDNFRDKKPLTDNPDRDGYIEVLRGQPIIQSYMRDSETGSGAIINYDIIIDYFNESNTLLHSESENTLKGDVHQWDINQFYGDIGVPNIEDVYYIETYIGGGVEKIKYKYIEPCFNQSSLIWENKYGSFDTFAFKHNLIDSNEIESYSYMKKYGGWDGNEYSFDIGQHREVTYKKKSNHKGEIVSDYMSEEKRNWLANSLILSNKVWIYKDGKLQAIKVTDLRYTKSNKRFDELKDLIVKFNYSYQENSILA